MGAVARGCRGRCGPLRWRGRRRVSVAYFFALYLAHARLGAPFEREREIVPTLAPFGRCIFPHISLCWCVCVSVQSPQHACVPTVAMRIMLHVNCGGQHKQDHFFFFFSTMKIRCACAAKLKYKKHAFTGLTFIASGDRNRETVNMILSQVTRLKNVCAAAYM